MPTEFPEANDRPRHSPGTDIVIILTRLGCGLQVAVNPDLIERAEHTPDTVITLVDGHKLVVVEPLEDVVALVRAWRASVAAEAITLARLASKAEHLTAVRAADPDDIDDRDDRDDPMAEAEQVLLADRASRGSRLGQVLRLPSREV
jgi:flagellar protein FlbD